MLSFRVSYLVHRALPGLIFPPVVVLALKSALDRFGLASWLSLAGSTGGVGLLSLLVMAIYVISKIHLSNRFHTREARRLNAIPIPIVQGKLPGNIDILWDMIFKWEYDYAGYPIIQISQTYGTIFNLNILWDDWVSPIKAAWNSTDVKPSMLY